MKTPPASGVQCDTLTRILARSVSKCKLRNPLTFYVRFLIRGVDVTLSVQRFSRLLTNAQIHFCPIRKWFSTELALKILTTTRSFDFCSVVGGRVCDHHLRTVLFAVRTRKTESHREPIRMRHRESLLEGRGVFYPHEDEAAV